MFIVDQHDLTHVKLSACTNAKLSSISEFAFFLSYGFNWLITQRIVSCHMDQPEWLCLIFFVDDAHYDDKSTLRRVFFDTSPPQRTFSEVALPDSGASGDAQMVCRSSCGFDSFFLDVVGEPQRGRDA